MRLFKIIKIIIINKKKIKLIKILLKIFSLFKIKFLLNMMNYSESIKDKIKNYSQIMFLIDSGLTGNKDAEMQF
jgi:hypothetical protein